MPGEEIGGTLCHGRSWSVRMIILLCVCIALLTFTNVILVAVLVALARVLDGEARKRGLLDVVDLLHRRKRWYA